MTFMMTAHSDIGIRRSKNQDALLIKTAVCAIGNICLCVLCDGMGGLDQGELASAAVIRRFESWFEHRLGKLLEQWPHGDVSGAAKDNDVPMDVHPVAAPEEKVPGMAMFREEWTEMIARQNHRIAAYAARRGIAMGTTVVALLLVDDCYFVMHAGDSRCYKIQKDDICLLTKDHTMLQYQIDHGIITEEDTANHPGKGILLQCIGASDAVMPDFCTGTIDGGTVFVLCSDGFCHRISTEEIYEKLRPDVCADEQRMQTSVKALVELNKKRRETDNISAAAVKVCLCREGDEDA